MMPPSFERFDYQLRSNKNVERKLIFDLLVNGRSAFGMSGYRYIGLGSMWFADHRLAHRMLGIDDLVSIERTIHADRADFNKPYLSVDVLPGEVSEVISELSHEYWEKPAIVWLDYDGLLNEEIALTLERLTRLLSLNSVIIITVNGVRRNYRNANSTSLATIERILGPVVPPHMKPPVRAKGPQLDVMEEVFPHILAESLLTYLAHKATASGRQDVSGNLARFVPLYNVSHKDGADMITVGGAITSGKEEQLWKKLLLEDRILPSDSGFPRHLSLDMVPITLKEKLALDALLPSASTSLPTAAKAKGIMLEAEQIEKYERYYRHFPIFMETPL